MTESRDKNTVLKCNINMLNCCLGVGTGVRKVVKLDLVGLMR